MYRRVLIAIPTSLSQQIEEILQYRLPETDFDITKINPKKFISNLLSVKRQRWLVILCREILNHYGIQVLEQNNEIYFAISEDAVLDPDFKELIVNHEYRKNPKTVSKPS